MSMQLLPLFSSKFILLFLVALTSIQNGLGDFRHFVFESPDNFTQHGFQCFQVPPDEPNGAFCQIKFVDEGSELPDYFPSAWRSLSGPMMYVESGLAQPRSYFRLERNSSAGPLPGDIVSFGGEYYAETEAMIGCLQERSGGPSHPWPAAPGDDDKENTTPYYWYQHKLLYQTRRNFAKLGFFVLNDRLSNFVVFRRLEIVIDEPANIHLRMENLEDAAKLGVECEPMPEDHCDTHNKPAHVETICELKSVSSASELPPYFGGAFRSLLVPNGNSIMYVERDVRTQHGRGHGQKLLFTLPVAGFSPDAYGVIQLRTVHYTEKEDMIGYGPLIESDAECERWTSFKTSNASRWVYGQNDGLEPIGNMIQLPNSKIGFLLHNDQQVDSGSYAVFLRLEIFVWFTPESVIGNPLTLEPSSSSATETVTMSIITELSSSIASTLCRCTEPSSTEPTPTTIHASTMTDEFTSTETSSSSSSVSSGTQESTTPGPIPTTTTDPESSTLEWQEPATSTEVTTNSTTTTTFTSPELEPIPSSTPQPSPTSSFPSASTEVEEPDLETTTGVPIGSGTAAARPPAEVPMLAFLLVALLWIYFRGSYSCS